MKRLIACALLTLNAGALPQPHADMLSDKDKARVSEFQQREADWRNGAVVYQIMVDRFAPSARLDAKRALYAAPRKLRPWSENPAKGPYLEKDHIWSHEVDYWGGDLASLRGKLDYVQQLGADVVYLNPIFESLSNHKYDASDYHKVDPVYGTREDLKQLAGDLHARHMKLVLDGVFNHMGRRSPMVKSHPDFFKSRNGQPIGWMDVENLPELDLESQPVRDYVYARPDSVVQSYLRNEDIDGWRLDVAFDLGFQRLRELTEAAHAAKPDSLTIGEIWNYPEEWHPSVDGVMNMHSRAIVLKMLNGGLPGPLAAQMWDTMVGEAGYEHLLKAWLVLDNHDTERLAHALPQAWQQKIARVLQFTLPGSPCLYYGSELGMSGGEDPENRAPMRWEQATDANPTLQLHRQLIQLRKASPALRFGDFRRLHSQTAFAFLRRTLSARDTRIIVANPTDHALQEYLQVRDSKMQDVTPMTDALGSDTKTTVFAGCIDLQLAPHQVVILQPDTAAYPKGYQRYDRLP